MGAIKAFVVKSFILILLLVGLVFPVMGQIILIAFVAGLVVMYGDEYIKMSNRRKR